MVVLNDDKDLVVILDLVKEFLHVVLGHPSAEDVVVFLLILHAGSQLPDIKVIGQLLEPVLRGDELRSTVGEHLSGLLVEILDLKVDSGDLTVELLIGVSGTSFKFILQLDPLKVERAEYGVHLLRLRGRHEISPVDKTFIALSFYKNGAQVIHKVFLHFVIKFYGYAAETVGNIFVMQHFMEITV